MRTHLFNSFQQQWQQDLSYPWMKACTRAREHGHGNLLQSSTLLHSSSFANPSIPSLLCFFQDLSCHLCSQKFSSWYIFFFLYLFAWFAIMIICLMLFVWLKWKCIGNREELVLVFYLLVVIYLWKNISFLLFSFSGHLGVAVKFWVGVW